MRILYTAVATATGAEMAVSIPDVSIEEVQRLTERAHQVWPYSNATRNSI